MSYTISKTATVNTDPTPTTGKTGTSTPDTSKSDASTLGGDYQTFLKLLTAQIQHQDPTSPMDTTQWTNQLVQYSEVEQQLKSNTYLQTIAGRSGAALTDGVALIGKSVDATTPTANVTNGKADWTYTLGATAAKATATIKDAKGTTVWAGPVSDLSQGTHGFSWDAKETNGKTAPDGAYTLSLTAVTAQSNTVATSVGVSGIVNAVTTDSNGDTLLTVGNASVPLSAVTNIRAAS